MKRLATLLILLTQAAAAQVCLSNCEGLVVTDSSVSLWCDIPGPLDTVDLVRMARYTSSTRDADGTQHPGYNPGNSATGAPIQGSDFLAGVTGQQVFPEASDDGGTTYYGPASCGSSICPSGAGVQPGGYTCDANDLIVVNTDAAPSPGPVVAPESPSHTNVGAAPAVTGNTYTVTDCADMQTTWATAAAQANSDNLIHEYAWNTTTPCHPGMFTTPATYWDLGGITTATGGIVITGGVADSDLDRHGARPEMDFFGHVPTLTWDPADWYPRSSLIKATTATKRFWFNGTFSIGTPTRAALIANQPADIAISNVSPASGTNTARTVTLASTSGLPNDAYFGIRVTVPGLQSHAATAGGTLTVNGASITIPSVTGTWSAGGGLTRKRIHAFTATAAVEPVLTMNHVLGEGFAYTISSITSNVLTVSGGSHQASTQNQAVWIDGCDAGSDGVNWVNGGSSGSGTMNLQNSVSNCSGGTVREVYLAELSNVSGISTNALSCLYRVIDSSSIKLLWCTDGATSAQADWSAGSSITGDATFDVPPYPNTVDLINMSEVSFAGIVFRGSQGSMPWATGSAAVGVRDHDAADIAWVDSFVDTTTRVRSVNPMTGKAVDTDWNQFYVSAVANISEAPRFYMRGVDAIGAGFYLFEEGLQNVYSLEDFTMKAGRMIWKEQFHTSAAGGSGRTAVFRQGNEFKIGCIDCEVDGMTMYDVPVIGSPSNAAWTFQTSEDSGSKSSKASGVPRGVEDIAVTNSYGSGRWFLSLGIRNLGGNDYARIRPFERFKVSNNLWFHREGIHGTPGDETLGVASDSFTYVHAGHVYMARVNNIEWSNNTFGMHDTSATFPYTFLYETDGGGVSPAAAALFSGNVQILSRDEPFDDARCGGTHTWAACDADWKEEGSASSRFTMEDTILIPCTTSANNTAWTTTNAAHTDVSGAFSGWPSPGEKPTIITGSADSQTCWQRILLAFNEDWTRKAALSGAGHDHEALMAAQGRPIIADDKLEFDSVTHAARIVGYVAPNDSPCHLAARLASANRSGAGVSAQDSGARTSRTVSLGLSSFTGQTIKLELLCGQGVIHHWQGTAP